MKSVSVFTFLVLTISILFDFAIAESENVDETEDPEICPEIVTRKKWGAKTSKAFNYLTIPVEYVVIHHTAGQLCSNEKTCSRYVRNIQSYHQNDLNFWDIAYNFLIGNDGRVYEGIGWHKEGAHTHGFNRRAIGIAFLGIWNEEIPSNKALQAAKNILECGVEIGELDAKYKLFGARQIANTESPGLTLYREIQGWSHHSESVPDP